jgi:indole-3-glycerol phosphate synthase
MSETFLDKILAVTRQKIGALKGKKDVSSFREYASAMRQGGDAHRLRTALARKDRPNIIAEIKRASPSKGVINELIDVGTIAKNYLDGGAAAISVLTEEDFFKGSLGDLVAVRAAVELPVLRKDFVIDRVQIYEAAAAGADAVLLIVAALTVGELKNFLHLIRGDLRMDAIVEVHTRDELAVAADAGADIIGINNRDLRSFDVSLDVSRRLIEHRPTDALMIAESGLSKRSEIDELRNLGFDGFLVGETLMRSGDIVQQVRHLTAKDAEND